MVQHSESTGSIEKKEKHEEKDQITCKGEKKEGNEFYVLVLGNIPSYCPNDTCNDKKKDSYSNQQKHLQKHLKTIELVYFRYQ
mmetsp:Transcript_2562/g.2663  ORF Transcript_2562/g.2663 Transcript_2562/m.2663 type:complete len:83 (+) Transcript_2562:69-317(+)